MKWNLLSRRRVCLSLLLVLGNPVLSQAATNPPPNIVFILADDLGFNQVGAYGDTPIQTPNLDRLAANGIRFTHAYAGNTVCSPSRVSLFTGRDGRLMENNSNTVQLKELDQTFAQELFTREAIRYIRREHQHPFFVFLAYSSPHAELAAPERYMKMYQGQFDETPYIGMSLGKEVEKYASYYPEAVANPNATLAAMVTALDDYIGQVVAVLEDEGVAPWLKRR